MRDAGLPKVTAIHKENLLRLGKKFRTTKRVA
jgi:hypothetical protein